MTTKTQTDYNKAYLEKKQIKQKKFDLEPETMALFEGLAEKTGKSHIQLLREAMRDLAAKHGL
ncbi:MAG: ribbon-helix-helix protein, CopG family [Neisseria sp.]|nr:ribbon-helix-helix protein, CopG family [Neisseria sp.]